MTERSESERAEVVALDPLEMLLDAARYAEGNGGTYRNPEWAKAARAAVAKARLVVPDQKPVAWIIPTGDNVRDSGFIDCMAWEEGEFTKPLYAKPFPPPAAGWDEAIETAIRVAKQNGAKVHPRVEAIRHNAPPDSGAGKSESKPKKAFDETFSAETVIKEAFFPHASDCDKQGER